MTPDELAAQLGISPSAVRDWLRRTYPRPPEERGRPWRLSAEHVAAARAHWGPPAEPEHAGFPYDELNAVVGEQARPDHYFTWLTGADDEWLPVAAYYPKHKLCVVPSDSLAAAKPESVFAEYGMRRIVLEPGADLRAALSAPPATTQRPEPPRRPPKPPKPPKPPRARSSWRSRSSSAPPQEPKPPQVSAIGAAAVARPFIQAGVRTPPHATRAWELQATIFAVTLIVGGAIGSAAFELDELAAAAAAFLAFGIAMDLYARGLAALVAARNGDPMWALACLAGGSPIVAAHALTRRTGPLGEPGAPLAALIVMSCVFAAAAALTQA